MAQSRSLHSEEEVQEGIGERKRSNSQGVRKALSPDNSKGPWKEQAHLHPDKQQAIGAKGYSGSIRQALESGKQNSRNGGLLQSQRALFADNGPNSFRHPVDGHRGHAFIMFSPPI